MLLKENEMWYIRVVKIREDMWETVVQGQKQWIQNETDGLMNDQAGGWIPVFWTIAKIAVHEIYKWNSN